MSTALKVAVAKAWQQASKNIHKPPLEEVFTKACQVSKDFREGKLEPYGDLKNRISISEP